MIKPIPLYLDRNDIIHLRAYLNSLYNDLDNESILIISQNQDLDDIFLSLWNEGTCINQTKI